MKFLVGGFNGPVANDTTVNVGQTLFYQVTVGVPADGSCPATNVDAYVKFADGTIVQFLQHATLGQGVSITCPGDPQCINTNALQYTVRAQDVGQSFTLAEPNGLPASGTNICFVSPAANRVGAILNAVGVSVGDTAVNTYSSCNNITAVVLQPCIACIKNCVNAIGETGLITYSGSVSNCSAGATATALNNVNVSNLVNGVMTLVTNIPVLSIGQSVAFSGSYANPNICQQVTDTIFVSGTEPSAVPTAYRLTASSSCSATCSNVFNPAITVTKNCPTNCSVPGGLMTFSGVVSNAGNIALTNVSVVDNVVQAGGGNVVTNISVLGVGQAVAFTGSISVPTNVCSLSDTLTAWGTNICSGLGVSNSSSATCPVCTTPRIQLIKLCGPAPIQGQSLTITGSVINIGNVGLTNIVISNSIAGGPYVVVANFNFSPASPLNPGESRTFTFTEPTDNVCNVPDTLFGVARDVCGNLTNATATADCPVVCQPVIKVWKQVVCYAPGGCEPFSSNLDTQKLAIGISTTNPANCPAFCYRIVVTNAGLVTLSNLVVVDDSIPNPDLNLSGCGFPSFLPVGGSATCIIDPVTHCADTMNVITASGVGQVNSNGVTTTTTVTARDTNNVVIKPISLSCNVRVLSTNKVDVISPSSCLDLGTPYVVQVWVTNTGSYALQNVTVTSTGVSPLCFSSLNIGDLAANTAVIVAECTNSCATGGTNNYLVAVVGEARQGTGTNHVCDYNAQGQHIVATNTVPCPASVCCVPHVGIKVYKQVICLTSDGTNGTTCEPFDNDLVNSNKTATGAYVPDTGAGGQYPAFCYRFKVCNVSNAAVMITSISDVFSPVPPGLLPSIQDGLTACSNQFQVGTVLQPAGQPGDCTEFCVVSPVTIAPTSQQEGHQFITTNVFTVNGIGTGGGAGQTVSSSDTNVVTIVPIAVSCEKEVSTNGVDWVNTRVAGQCISIPVGTNALYYRVTVNNLSSLPLIASIIDQSFNPPCNQTITLPAGGSVTTNLCDGQSVQVPCPPDNDNIVQIAAVVDTSLTNVCVFSVTNGMPVRATSECSACWSCPAGAACRVTGGGRQDTPLTCPDTNVRYVTHGGQVGAPVGISNCVVTVDNILGNPCIHGRWTHVRHLKGGLEGNFHARYFDTLDCACLATNLNAACQYDGGVFGEPTKKHAICNPGDRVAGPEPRPSPANKIVFTGVGDWTCSNGRRTPRACLFRVDIEDRSEPGGSHPKGQTPPPDRYRIRIWVLTPAETAQLRGGAGDQYLLGFRTAISACNGVDYRDGGAVSSNGAGCDQNNCNGDICNGGSTGTITFPGGTPVRTPNVDDGGVLERGNHQIHPQIKNCDPSNPQAPPVK